MVAVAWVASVVATVAALTVALPQLRRVLRGRRSTGVSVPGWVNGCVSFAAWVVYATGTQAWSLMPATLAPALVWLGTTLVIWRYRTADPTPREWWPTVAWTIVVLLFVVAATVSGWAVLGALLTVSSLWSYGPQAWRVWTAIDVDAVAGVSVATWWLATVEAVSFGIAGWTDPLVVGWAALAAALALAVIVGVRRMRAAGVAPERAAGSGALARGV